MITRIIQGEQIVFEGDENISDESRQEQMIKISESSTVKSIEFTFTEGLNLEQASDVITGVGEGEVLMVKVILND